MREVNATSPKNIGTNSMEDSPWKLPETSFFSHFLTVDALRRNDKGVNLGLLSKKGENNAYGSTVTSAFGALCKKHKGVIPSRYEKKMTKVTQDKISGRLKGNVKFSLRLISNVRFLGAT